MQQTCADLFSNDRTVHTFKTHAPHDCPYLPPQVVVGARFHSTAIHWERLPWSLEQRPASQWYVDAWALMMSRGLRPPTWGVAASAKQSAAPWKDRCAVDVACTARQHRSEGGGEVAHRASTLSGRTTSVDEAERERGRRRGAEQWPLRELRSEPEAKRREEWVSGRMSPQVKPFPPDSGLCPSLSFRSTRKQHQQELNECRDAHGTRHSMPMNVVCRLMRLSA